MARKDDAIDVLCRQWAKTRRELVGRSQPKEAHQYLGALRCTLSSVRDYHDGASSTGQIKQFYPEVYTGEEFEINRAFNHMELALREIMDAHYVDRSPVKAKVHRLGLKWSEYWSRVGRAKQYVAGWLDMSKQNSVDFLLTERHGKTTLGNSVEK